MIVLLLNSPACNISLCRIVVPNRQIHILDMAIPELYFIWYESVSTATGFKRFSDTYNFFASKIAIELLTDG
jgi:hypothetical protein